MQLTYEFRVDALEAAGPNAEHARPDGLHAEALAQLVNVDLAILVRNPLQDPGIDSVIYRICYMICRICATPHHFCAFMMCNVLQVRHVQRQTAVAAVMSAV